jgi:hypothetical protein
MGMTGKLEIFKVGWLVGREGKGGRRHVMYAYMYIYIYIYVCVCVEGWGTNMWGN